MLSVLRPWVCPSSCAFIAYLQSFGGGGVWSFSSEEPETKNRYKQTKCLYRSMCLVSKKCWQRDRNHPLVTFLRFRNKYTTRNWISIPALECFKHGKPFQRLSYRPWRGTHATILQVALIDLLCFWMTGPPNPSLYRFRVFFSPIPKGFPVVKALLTQNCSNNIAMLIFFCST